MKLRSLYEKIYERVFSVPFFKKILEKLPFLEKVLAWEIVSYLVFGVLTTVVNFVTLWLVNLPVPNAESKVLFQMGAIPFKWVYVSNAVAWIVAVVFSYVTNKLFVFESRATDSKTVLRELAGFFGSRIISFLVFEELAFGLLMKLFGMWSGNEKLVMWVAKLAVAVFVVAFNYVASKLVIFRKKKTAEEKEE